MAATGEKGNQGEQHDSETGKLILKTESPKHGRQSYTSDGKNLNTKELAPAIVAARTPRFDNGLGHPKRSITESKAPSKLQQELIPSGSNGGANRKAALA